MSEKPILFSGEMIRAILDGRKTITRRVIKPLALERPEWIASQRRWNVVHRPDGLGRLVLCPYGQPGDRLWVKEVWTLWSNATDWYTVSYAAEAEVDGATVTIHPVKCERDLRVLQSRGVKSARFMPREFSRITLEVTGVRVERAQEITDMDARAEGVDCRLTFSALWDTINQARGFGWDMNPWCWCISFRRIERGNEEVS